MAIIRKTEPPIGEQPSWAEYWAEVRSEWMLAAREVCQLSTRVQTVVASYLRWQPQLHDADEAPWWRAELDWEQLATDIANGKATLSSTEKAIALVAVGLLDGRGVMEWQALLSAGYLTDVLSIVQRCDKAIEAGGAAH